MEKVIKEKAKKPKKNKYNSVNKYNSIKITFIGYKPVIRYEFVSNQQIKNVIKALSEDVI